MQTGRVRERWMLLVAAMVGVWLSSSDRTVLGAVDGRSTRVQLDREADLILSLSCDDRPRADGAHEASAFTIVVDDSAVQEMLVFPGSGKRQYDAIIGPLGPGSHTLSVRPSRSWRTQSPPTTNLRARIMKPEDEDAALVRYAPALWVRADTVGTANDLPLVMYAEKKDETTSATTITYSMIFSNEDAGTPTRALMARWGRTTDIEWAYSVRLEHGSVVGETFQGQPHDTRPFAGQRIGGHAVLLVATLNNVFSDRGTGVALVRPMPRLVDLAQATRESVMDLEPWTYLVMAHELHAEHKVVPGGAWDINTIDDPRRYVYLEARLDLRSAAAIAHVRSADGVWHASHGGIPELRIDRNAWVRVAVPAGDSAPASIGWSCEPAARANAGEGAPSCRISATRAFRLGASYEVGPNLIQPASLTLAAGELGVIDARARSSQ